MLLMGAGGGWRKVVRGGKVWQNHGYRGEQKQQIT